MNPNILIQGPFRRPKWRLDRVVQLISHRPDPLRPGRHDDHNVRVYRRVLLELADAGDDGPKRDSVLHEYPHVCHAHGLHYSPDLERRQILEARLLTDESIEEIASRFATAPEVVEYYEKLFFHVRDRLQCSVWIRKVIIGPRSDYRDNGKGAMTDEERGYVYRLFAYFGGPLALDAVISGMVSTRMPQRPEEVCGWFDNTLGQIVRTNAAVAATALRLNQRNMMQMIRLGLRVSARTATKRAKVPNQNFEEWAEQVLASIGGDPIGTAVPELDESPKSLR